MRLFLQNDAPTIADRWGTRIHSLWCIMHYATIEEPGRLNRAFGKSGSLERQKNLCLGRSTGFSIRFQNFTTDTDAVSSLLKKEQKITISNGRGILIASLAGKSTFSDISEDVTPPTRWRKSSVLRSESLRHEHRIPDRGPGQSGTGSATDAVNTAFLFLKEPIPRSALRKGTLIPSFNTNSLS